MELRVECYAGRKADERLHQVPSTRDSDKIKVLDQAAGAREQYFLATCVKHLPWWEKKTMATNRGGLRKPITCWMIPWKERGMWHGQQGFAWSPSRTPR